MIYIVIIGKRIEEKNDSKNIQSFENGVNFGPPKYNKACVHKSEKIYIVKFEKINVKKIFCVFCI